MRRRTLIAALALCFLAAGPALVAEEQAKQPTKEEAIRELLRVGGAAANMEFTLEQMIGSFRQALPQAPPGFWASLTEEYDLNELIDLLVPIYDKHLTREEIDATIEFFRSPLGRSWVEKQPLILQDSYLAGQQWGMAVGMRIQKRVQEWKARPAAEDPKQPAEQETGEERPEADS